MHLTGVYTVDFADKAKTFAFTMSPVQIPKILEIGPRIGFKFGIAVTAELKLDLKLDLRAGVSLGPPL